MMHIVCVVSKDPSRRHVPREDGPYTTLYPTNLPLRHDPSPCSRCRYLSHVSNKSCRLSLRSWPRSSRRAILYALPRIVAMDRNTYVARHHHRITSMSPRFPRRTSSFSALFLLPDVFCTLATNISVRTSLYNRNLTPTRFNCPQPITWSSAIVVRRINQGDGSPAGNYRINSMAPSCSSRHPRLQRRLDRLYKVPEGWRAKRQG